MRKINIVFVVVAVLLSLHASAQFSQDKSNYEYMFKAEAGYMPFVSNIGKAGDNGYYIDDQRHVANINVINGVNLYQEFFVGLGVGAGYVAQPKDLANGWLSALVFIDMDYRPLDVEFSPMVGARLGASYLMADTPYGNTLQPYAELLTGLNWFYRYRYRNMERNYRSVFVELGVAYTQQTIFLPVRVGIRF